jgi:isoleucyl-tRNA synthetase
LIAEELNVKEVEFAAKADQYISYTVLPDLNRLGPRLGKRLPALKTALAKADAAALLNELETKGSVTLPIDGENVALDKDDLQVRLQAKPGWAAAQGKSSVVVLATELNEALIREGLARELVHALQSRRKDMELKYTARIRVGLVTESADLQSAAKEFLKYIQGETLATEFVFQPLAGVAAENVAVGEFPSQLFVAPA